MQRASSTVSNAHDLLKSEIPAGGLANRASIGRQRDRPSCSTAPYSAPTRAPAPSNGTRITVAQSSVSTRSASTKKAVCS